MARKRVFIILAIILFCVLLGTVFHHAYLRKSPPLYKIRSNGYPIFYPDKNAIYTVFRKSFSISQTEIRNAWLSISADNSYELYVNGSLIGFDRNYINTNGFQSSISESSQRIGDEAPFNMRNVSEIMMESYENGIITTFYDIGDFLRAGKNVFAVFVQTDGERASLVLDGEVESSDGVRIAILTDNTWKTSPVLEVKDGIYCQDYRFDDAHWLDASADWSKATLWATLNPQIFGQSMRGWWMYNPSTPQGSTYFRTVFQISKIPKDAWIRLAASSRYDLFCNGEYLGGGMSGTIDVYNIRSNMRKGKNVLAVALRSENPASESKLNEICFDGTLLYKDTSSPLSSNLTWYASGHADNGWTDIHFNKGWEEALNRRKFNTADPVGPKKYHYTPYYYSVDYLMLVIGICLFLCMTLAAMMLLRITIPHIDPLESTAFACILPILIMAVVFLLKIRFGESQNKLLFFIPWFWRIMFQINVTVFFLGILLRSLRKSSGRQAKTLSLPLHVMNTHSYQIALFLIILIGLVLRIYKLGYQGFQADENVSMSAVEGILKTGVPLSPSGIWYTRGPLYHYFMALYSMLCGVGTFASRVPSVLAGTILIYIVYTFCRDLFGQRKIGLLASLLVAIDPWLIFFSRTARFYPFTQLFVVISILNFFKGFVCTTSKRHQNIFFVTMTLAILTQEVAVTILPALFIGFLYFNKRFYWRRDFNCLAGFMVMMVVTLADVGVFSVKCLTPIVNISTSTASITTPHLQNISSFFNHFFVGDNRLHIVYSILFFMGLPYAITQKDKTILFLYFTIMVTLLTITVLIIQIAMRYTFAIYPLLIIIAVYVTLKGFDAILFQFRNFRNNQMLKCSCSILMLVLFIMSVQPLRLLKSFNTRVNQNNTSAMEYVKKRLQPGDIIVTGMPQHAALTIGQSDYYLVGRKNFDEVYRKQDGTLIDRWGGGEYLTNTDKLRAVFENNNRVWIIIDYHKGQRMQREMKQFIENNAENVYHPFSSMVYLWDQDRGVFKDVAREGAENNLF
jgi:hypothetical protein